PVLKPTPISAVTSVDVRTLNNYQQIADGRVSVINQIRLKIDPASSFATLLLQQDSSETGPNNAFRSDSIFRNSFFGFGIRSSSGNGILYTDLMDGTTRLEVHYRSRKDNVLDTGFTSLTTDRK